MNQSENGNSDKLKYRAARDAWKIAERFLLTDGNVLYYMNSTPRNQQDNQEDLRLRLVVPTTMIQEVLQNNHDSLEGGHQGVVRTYQRVRQDYYWLGLYADVEKHVKSSSKSKPQLRGYYPGNILAERPFQIISMDFVIRLPKSRRGNTALLLFQCAFTGFVIAKPMFKVAQVFEECIYRRFGAPSLISHDRDLRFMREVFQAFAEMMQSRPRATLSYRPQVNGQQARSVKTVMQSVKVYAEDPLKQD
ncbi:LOW QUALITY PROTEIN: reverse transcriptase [Phytophthora megakarya]|uniref:Reverse transcriptase n=1 Tax=Phytophthora megakarya TaxID=4795 RepID=A0A225W7T8_9STRA|nr:LOW QUALITY PROTEIN: reverse transcriptase [Phytophthora megakarya]